MLRLCSGSGTAAWPRFVPVAFACVLAALIYGLLLLGGSAPESSPPSVGPPVAARPDSGSHAVLGAATAPLPAGAAADTANAAGVRGATCEPLDEYITLFRNQEDSFFHFSRPGMGAFFDAASARGIDNGFLWADWADAESSREVLDFTRIDGMLNLLCRRGMRAWVIVSLYRAPAWVLQTWPDAAELDATGRTYESFAWAAEPALAAGLTFLFAATRHIVGKYGACIIGVNPNLNNEVEAKWTQQWDAFRDYSVHTRRAYGAWLTSRNPDQAYWASRWGVPSVSLSLPDPLPVAGLTDAEDLRPAYWDWTEFREMLLADVHQRMCQAVLLAAPGIATFLHVPTFLSSIDAIYAVSFPALADSPWVHHMSLDSNLVDYTHSAPLDAIHIKLLASLARPYQAPRRGIGAATSSALSPGLRTHYELAVERLDRKCIPAMTDSVGWALGAGVGSIGYTNVPPDDVVWLVDCAQRAFEPGYAPGVAAEGAVAAPPPPTPRRGRAAGVKSAACKPATMLVVVPYESFYAYRHFVPTKDLALGGVLDALAGRADFRTRIVDVVVDLGRPELQLSALLRYDVRLYLRPAVVTRRVSRLAAAMLAAAPFEVVDLPGYARSQPLEDIDAFRCGPSYLDRSPVAHLADLLRQPRWRECTAAA